MHRVQRSDEGSEGRELEERHRVLTTSALLERQLLVEEYVSQYTQLSQLMRQQVEEERRAGAHSQSETDHTPVHQESNQSLVQPTPEREENLRSYLRRHSHREVRSPRARHELFHSDTAPASRSPAPTAAAAGNRRELGVREGLREQIGQERVSAILENEGTEGLRDAVQRERDKYASLLEMRRALEETQMRMPEQSLSPGPPPLPGTDLRPQYRLYRSNSDMELASLAGNEPATVQPDYWENTIPVRDYIHPSHSLPAVYRATGEIDPLAPPPAHPSLIPPVAGEPSVLHKIADNLSQLLHFQQQQQQQQEFVHSAPFYASSVPQIQVAPPTTPLPQFTCYPPSTPGLPPQQPVHYFPPPLGSTPHHIPYFPSYLPAAAPSPMPYYQSLPPYPPLYPAPVPFYATSAPTYMHHSLPTPAPTGLYPPNQWLQTLPPPVPTSQPPHLLTPPLSQSLESRVPVAASCTQTDLTFVENPLSSQLPHQLTTAQDHPLFYAGRQLPMLPPRTQQQHQEEEVYSPIQLPVAPTVQRSAAGSTSDRRHRMSLLQQESPLFDQVKERIYSEVASLVSENETRPYYLMELLRAAQLLNTDYLRQTGLSSLKRVINNFLNTDRLEPEAFSALVSTEQESPAGEGTAAEEGVYSPTQNFPLARHYLDTNISGSSGNAAAERCVSRGYCHQSEPAGHQRGYTGQEGGSDISEITTSELSFSEYVCVSPWEQQVRILVTRLIPLLKEHLDRTCDPRLLALIHCETMCLLSELFPEEVALRVRGLLDKDLKEVLSRYTSQLLRDCGEELLVDVSHLFFSQVDPLTLTLSSSLQLSFESEAADAGGSERECRDRERDDALATAPLKSPPVQREQDEEEEDKPGDETFTLSSSTVDGLFIQGHKYTESLPPVPSSPTLSPPRINIINLTLSEPRPLDETATSERSEDYSRSRTVDTVSETASCTASDLSEIPPSLKLQVNPVPDSSPPPPPPVTSALTVSSLRDSSSSPDSEELPPFANTCLSQGSFTLIPPSSLAPGLVDVLSDDPPGFEFIAEVLSLTSPTQLEFSGDSTAIIAPQ